MCDCSNSAFATALAARFTQTAEVLRQIESRDRYGAVSGDKTTVAHRYKCRVVRDGSPQNPALIAEKSVVRSEWRILMPLSADILPDDKIRIDQQTYEVLDTDQGRAAASFLTVFARKTT
jgi:hypothetical protein